MSSLGQNFRYGFYDVPAMERMQAIRDAGFDDVMIWWGNEYIDTDGTPEQLFDMAKKAGLNVKTVHFPTTHTPDLWCEGEAGDAYEKQLIAALYSCGERGIGHLVVHTTKKMITPNPNATGVRRVQNAVRAAEEAQVDLAWENTRFLEYNQYLYDHVLSDRMKFCFDCGHANCFTPDEDPLGRFGDRMVTMHLHDNHGAVTGDEHMMPGEGAIDYHKLYLRLAALNPESYNLESHMSERDLEENLSMQEYLSRSYAAVKKITAGQW